MGGKKAPKVDVPDPEEIIRLQDELNRVNIVTPFGSSKFTEGENGERQQVVEAAPGLQGAIDQALSLGSQGSQNVNLPPGVAHIFGSIAGRVGDRYGDKPGQEQDIPKPQQQAAVPPPSITGPPLGLPGAQLPQVQLNQIPGANQGILEELRRRNGG